MANMLEASKKARKPEYPILDSITYRWSPRAMTGEFITDDELNTLFEAARWAPSSFNEQPWRFVYAKRDSKEWKSFLNLLVEPNQVWAKNAAVLVVIISKKTFTHNDKPNKVHSFDAGSAWQNLALQGFSNGLVVHGMGGFDYEKAKEVLEVPDSFTVEAMCAIGKPAPKDTLPEDVAKMEQPSGRNPVSDFVMEGKFRSSD